MNRPLIRETIGYRPGPTRELASRRRTFWAVTTSLMAGNEPPVAPRPRGNHPSVREIHKNAWLKRQSAGDKKGTAFSKKSEKFWVVFCVHDDVEALLEFYSEPKMGSIHKPLSAISLNSCLHVSPSIMGQDNEYQFAVTLQTEVIRLVAANWEQMIEWVESLQGKLREMNILSPKDNLYSKLPEVNKLATVASTRDPNSPLPPTPSALAAAAERQRAHNHNQSNRTESQLRSETTSSRNQSQPSDTSSRLTANGNTERERTPRSSQHSSTPESHSDHPSVTQTGAQPRSGEETQEGPAPPTKPKPQINVKLKVDINNVHRSSSGNVIQSQQRHHFTTGPLPSTSTTVVLIGNGDMRIHNNTSDSSSNQRGDGRSCSASVVVSCSQNISTSQQSTGGVDPPAKSPVGEEASVETGSVEGGGSGSSQENSSHSNSNPCVSRVSVNYTEVQFIKPAPKSRQRQGVPGAATSNGTSSSTPPTTDPETLLAVPKRTGAPKTVKSTSSENIYEHIYIPDRNGVKPVVTNSNQTKTNSQTSNDVDGRSSSGRVYRSASQRSPEEEVPSGSGRDFHARRIIKGNNSGSSQRSSSLGRIEHPSSSNRAEVSRDSHDVSRRNGNRNRQPSEATRAVGNSTFFENNATSSQLQGSPIDALIGCRSGEYRLRRDDYLIRMTGNGGENDNQSSDSSQSSEPYENMKVQPNGARVPLKEQQVMHLQMEINHPGGVRVILRKKDCLSSIAFVDYLGAVWVAGWKQTQFPVLYYAFHVGDQILKVAGVTVQSSIEASRAIKMVSSMQVEFIIRRLPYGKVYALKRSRDGEPLGLVAEGGSGEISEVLQDGLAARYGLPPKGLSVDGQAPCNWYLTEVNNRPLSLMSKENEVKDRLNAVGKEISILVQPADLVKHLRKNLKSFKGFKDYVVG